MKAQPQGSYKHMVFYGGFYCALSRERVVEALLDRLSCWIAV